MMQKMTRCSTPIAAAAVLQALKMKPTSLLVSPVANIADLLALKIVSKSAHVLMAGKLPTGPEKEVKDMVMVDVRISG